MQPLIRKDFLGNFELLKGNSPKNFFRICNSYRSLLLQILCLIAFLLISYNGEKHRLKIICPTKTNASPGFIKSNFPTRRFSSFPSFSGIYRKDNVHYKIDTIYRIGRNQSHQNKMKIKLESTYYMKYEVHVMKCY